MNIDLGKQAAIVTGASRGIGREIALQLARSGAAVALAARSADALAAVAAEIDGAGGRAIAIPTDVADPAAVADLAARTLEAYGRIDILVNNAGISYVANLVMSKDERWREVLETNVLSAYYCSKAVLRSMIKAKYGRIVNISSISALVGAGHNSAYAASKAAVIGLTRSLAIEVGKLGITVNAVCPWHVETELSEYTMGARAMMFGQTAGEYLAGLIEESPQRRLITTREVAAATVFLCGADARGINGTTLNLSGGTYIT